MIHSGKTDWLHLLMFTIIAVLAGGWLIYYINISFSEQSETRYFLYKVVHEDANNKSKISDPVSGYGKITVLGKITGDSVMSASISNYFQIDNEYFERYAGKFVEATGYIDEYGANTPHWSPFGLIIESIKLAEVNNIDDTGKKCRSSADCRYQCVTDTADYMKACPNTKADNPTTFCGDVSGKCTSNDISDEKSCTGKWELNVSASHMIGSCAEP